MICDLHNKEMRQNSRGWYCPTVVERDNEGNPIFCSFKVPLDAPDNTPKGFMAGRQDPNAVGKTASLFIAAFIQSTGNVPIIPNEQLVDDFIALAQQVVDKTTPTPKDDIY